MKLLSKMYALVAESFKDVTDKQGRPYFEHCLHVMQTCGLTDENSLCIAIAHDILEDCPQIDYDYINTNFNRNIAEGISILTHKGESYDEYIKLISFSPHLIPIKLADLRHNMDASRLKGLSKKDFDRMEKYMRAYTYLSKI